MSSVLQGLLQPNLAGYHTSMHQLYLARNGASSELGHVNNIYGFLSISMTYEPYNYQTWQDTKPAHTDITWQN